MLPPWCSLDVKSRVEPAQLVSETMGSRESNSQNEDGGCFFSEGHCGSEKKQVQSQRHSSRNWEEPKGGAA
jgi:hypothetical protein